MYHHTVPFPPDPTDLEHVQLLFQALADPTRVTLLLALQGGEASVNTLVERLNQPQSTVSRHLTILRQAGFVTTRREGPRVHYRLADAHLSHLLTQAFSHAQHQRLHLPDHPVTGDLPAGGER